MLKVSLQGRIRERERELGRWAAPAATEAKQVAVPVPSPGTQRVKLLGKQRLVISASLGLNAPERLPVIGHQ